MMKINFKRKKQDQLQKLRIDFYKNKVKKQAIEEKMNPLPHPDNTFVSLTNIQKIYPNGYYSVVDFNLNIKEGEFIVLVGPSGCGKTTTLRMICGLEDITAGALYIDGVYSNDLEPKDRGISMVFQNYALFPHLSVYDNLAYGLKVKKVYAKLVDEAGNQVIGIDQNAIKELRKEKKWYLKNDPNSEEIEKIDHDIEEYQNKKIPLFIKRKLTKKEIDEKIHRAASILNLEQLLSRKPSQLSGGQCQRVALGRVIVSDSKLLLMDEPLSNLDAKLRASMRSEIIKLHKTLHATTVYVTHDQVEAMTMADRIVIMDRAHIKQIGTPAEVYENPNCLFVAQFIGSPSMNIFDVEYRQPGIYLSNILLKEDIKLENIFMEFYRKRLEEEKEALQTLDKIYEGILLEAELEEAQKKIEILEKIVTEKNYPLKFGIRPERIAVASKSTKKIQLEATILSSELLGDEYHIYITIGDTMLLMKLPNTYKFEIGDQILITFNESKCYIFDSISGKRIV
ncbi:MAG: ATP-binding cassette domain-containing protein [Anaeroplasmataceae bacterium]|nr:ATP-binding cassette domain-containing protein [Anaeroplasmataceae bacterium]